MTPGSTATSSPRSWPSISAKVSAKSAPAEVITPGMSIRLGALASRDSRMATAASASVASPTGTLMKKIQPQLRYWLSRPPSSGPTASASAPTALQMPTAAARCRPSVKVAEMMASVVGVTSAAPRPWTARLITSTSTLPAKPGHQRGRR